jgi:hypothetical protein
MARTHAQRIRSATTLFTPPWGLAAPTPMIEVVVECVVEAGMPRLPGTSMMVAPVASAAKALNRRHLHELVAQLGVVLDSAGNTIRFLLDCAERILTAQSSFKSDMKNKWRTFALVLVGIILALMGVVVITGVQCCNSSADGDSTTLADRRPSGNEAAVTAAPERISLYSVPLRCPLVTGLGCGSESKPIMTKLDGHSAVAGAWLNHAGTTLAVFWKEGTDATQRSEAVSSAFQNHAPPANCPATLATLL